MKIWMNTSSMMMNPAPRQEKYPRLWNLRGQWARPARAKKSGRTTKTTANTSEAPPVMNRWTTSEGMRRVTYFPVSGERTTYWEESRAAVL